MVYVVDFDNTIVGDIRSLAFRYYMVTIDLVPLDIDSELARMRPLFSRDVRAFIRPHFDQFMRLADTQKRAVYIFTASADKWANYIVPIIEEILEVRFARPIFTRDDCVFKDGSFVKSIAAVRDRIGRARGLVIIDDRIQAWPLDVHRLIVCPKYVYTEFIDVLNGVNPAIIKHPDVLAMYSKFTLPPISPVARYKFCIAEIKRVKKEYLKLATTESSMFWKNLCTQPTYKMAMERLMSASRIAKR